MDYIIVVLVFFFLSISLINFSFTRNRLLHDLESDSDSNPKIALALYIVSIIEMVILICFLIEIFVKCFVFGIHNYFSNKWLLFDATVIVLSMIFLILDWKLDNVSFRSAS